jgi:hypothetical protein
MRFGARAKETGCRHKLSTARKSVFLLVPLDGSNEYIIMEGFRICRTEMEEVLEDNRFIGWEVR